jgi:hypothetical protein
MWSKPVIYEVRYKFSFEDDFIPDDYLIYSDSQVLYSNESAFIEIKEVLKIFENDIIFGALGDMAGVDDFSDYYSSSLQDLDLENDKGIFSLKIKNQDKELADDIAVTLIESLGDYVMNNDKEIFDNTLSMILEDKKSLEGEIAAYSEKIDAIEKELEEIYSQKEYEEFDSKKYPDVFDKRDEILLYRGQIIEREDKISELDELSRLFKDEKEKLKNRIEIISADPDYNVENDRAINSIIVILLSLLTGIVVVLVVNYIYKLKDRRKS